MNQDARPARELATVDETERADLARVVESLVIRGDISGLSPADRIAHYTRLCTRLRLDPATQPLVILRLNGKEVFYPTKTASDQLAAIWGVDRRLVERPHVVETGAGKIIQATCEAVWRGRVDTCTGAVPVPAGGGEALCNALLKCETKSKRRATLSILGFGMLAEDEIESIPVYAKQALPQVDVAGVLAAGAPEAGEHPALARLRDKLAESGTVGTLDAAVGAYGDVRDATADPDVLRVAGDLCVEHLETRLGLTKIKTAFQRGLVAAESARAAARRAALAGTPAPATAPAPAAPPDLLTAITGAASGKVLLTLAARLEAYDRPDRGLLVETYVHAWERVIHAATHPSTLGAIGKALASMTGRLGEETRAGVAETMARRTRELTPPEPPKGGTAPPANDVTDVERAAIAEEPTRDSMVDDSAVAQWIADVATKAPAKYVAASFVAHEAEFGADWDRAHAAYVVRMGQLVVGPLTAMAMLREARLAHRATVARVRKPRAARPLPASITMAKAG